MRQMHGPIREMLQEGKIWSVAWSPDWKKLATGGGMIAPAPYLKWWARTEAVLPIAFQFLTPAVPNSGGSGTGGSDLHDPIQS